MAIFPTFFLRQYKPGKCLFQAIKTKNSKRQKIDIFPKGLAHGFGPKMAIFPTFVCRQYWPGKCLLRYSRTIDAFLGFKKQEVQKIEKLTFLQNPWFWSKNGHFSSFIFLGNIGKESVFYDILERRNAFLGHKNKKFKTSKN